MADVLIISGSKSDNEYTQKASSVLNEFGITNDVVVSSAHRQPLKTQDIASGAEKDGYKVIIAMAGYAAALPGFVASHSKLPVIGVPLPSSDLVGIDAALAIMQMPGGVPVASMGIGSAGAKNAALMAVRILSLSDTELNDKLQQYIANQAKG
jgi:5-(carboxyamino)imidazole ribonucleotide mutase